MDNETHNPCWVSLNEELLILIFSKLDFDSLVSTARVCHSWRSVAHHPECWDLVHSSHHERFVDNHIKEVTVPDQGRLNLESAHVIRHAGVRAKWISVDPTSNDGMVETIAERCPSIESISLRSCRLISAAALVKLFNTCKHLKLVDVRSCYTVSTLVIEEMGRSCPDLVGLNLGGMHLTEETATAIGKFMTKLKWLNINSAMVSSKALFNILDSCSELQYVSARWCRGLIMNSELENKASRIPEFQYCLARYTCRSGAICRRGPAQATARLPGR